MRRFVTIVILGGTVAACAVQATTMSESSIVRHSPFLPPDFNPPGEAGLDAQVPTTQSQFQFKGVYQLDGEYYFHIYDQRAQRGSWISRDSSTSGYPSIVDFDASRDRLTVEMNGTQLQLDMENPGDGSLAISSSEPVARPEASFGSQNTRQTNSTAIRRPVIRSLPEITDGSPVRRVTFSPRQNNQ